VAGLRYVGRFAPSPTGPLHAGSLVAALASWLDARAWGNGRGATWLVRIEDIDPPRCQSGADQHILRQLADCGLSPDEPPTWQSDHGFQHDMALRQLQLTQLCYPCGCSRADVARALREQGRVHQRDREDLYPGTCRDGLRGKPARAWRLDAQKALLLTQEQQKNAVEPTPAAIFSIANARLTWHDRRLGPQTQDLLAEAGDFVLRRADGLWSYQLAVVEDDARQGVTHVVRGEDLADNTPRQILLQAALGYAHPSYLHLPLVRASDGAKLSKQHGAPAIETDRPEQALQALDRAAAHLALPLAFGTRAERLALWVRAWRGLYNPGP
jgi:glutamyl-Q tRNA(Asp) synthetase